MTAISHEWVTGPAAWQAFTQEHPELGYPPGKWGFHNFLRRYRQLLVEVDAIRLAKGKFWVAHISRFSTAAFDCATGKSSGRGEGHASALALMTAAAAELTPSKTWCAETCAPVASATQVPVRRQHGR